MVQLQEEVDGDTFGDDLGFLQEFLRVMSPELDSELYMKFSTKVPNGMVHNLSLTSRVM